MAEFLVMDSQGWPYGLNLSKNEEAIADTELVQAENCEYSEDDEALRTVPGVTIKMTASADITSLFYNRVYKLFYYTVGTSVYETKDFLTSTLLGTITGASKPVYCMYSDICLIASGAQLQAISAGTTLQTVSASPDRCDYVTVRTGRVLAYATNSDELLYSAIGDYTSWANVAADSSSAQKVKVGYKDPGNIIAVDFLSKAVMVYKEGGRAYKIVGEPQDSDYSVQPVSQTAYCSSIRSTVSVDSKSYYLGKSGFMSFQPTNAYGDVAPFEEGLNIDPVIIGNIDDTCELWHVPPKKQIWLKVQGDKRVYMYHYVPRYSDGRGAFTVRTMAYNLHDVCCVGDTVYVAYGNKIGLLDDSTDLDDTMQIQTAITSRNKLASKHSILVMNRLFVSNNLIDGYGTIKCGKKTKTLVFATKSGYAYDATEYAYDADYYAYLDEYTRSYKVGGGSNKSVQVQIIVQKGAVSIRLFNYQYLEV